LHDQCTIKEGNTRGKVFQVLRELHPDKNEACLPQASQKFIVCRNAQEGGALEGKYKDMTFQDYFTTTDEGQQVVAAHAKAAQAAKTQADHLAQVAKEAAEKLAREQQEAAKATRAAAENAKAANRAAASANAAARAAEQQARAAPTNERAQAAAREARQAAADARSLAVQAQRALEITMQAQIALGMGTEENPFDLTDSGGRARAVQTIATRFSAL
jgi:hypothetical protein